MRWAWALLLLAAQAAPEEEYKAKLAQISKSSASKLYSVGEYLSSAQMHLWAREQYNKVVEFDPDHEGARKKLGYKKADSGWENDPTAKIEGNKKKDADADKVRKLYTEKLDSAGKDISRLWNDLALWCKKNSMAKEATEAYRKAVEYDPTNAAARKELGYEKDAKGVWISKAERELRKDMKDGILKAPSGAASSETTQIESKLGLKHQHRESVHFLMESPHLKDADLAGLIQHAEHAYAMFHKISGEEDLFGGRKMNHVVLKDKAQHLRYVDAFEKGSPAQMELARKSSGAIGFPVSEHYQDTSPIPSVEDWTVHSTVQILAHIFVGDGTHHWIIEGFAYHFTRLMKDSASTYCVDLAGTSPGAGDSKDLRDPANWPVILKVWIREGKDSNIDKVLKCTNLADFTGQDTLKAWSLIDFMMAEHREKFLSFCRALKGGANLEEALKGTWGWTSSDLDQRWKQYVRTSY